MSVIIKELMDEDIFFNLASQELPEERVFSYHNTSIFQCLESEQTFLKKIIPLKPHEDKSELEQGMQFQQIDFFPSLKKPAQDIENHLESQQISSTNLTPMDEKKKCCNNAVDYIIKHCLKKVTGQDCKELLSSCCRLLGQEESHVYRFWEEEWKKLRKKHMGINRWEKMVNRKQPQIQVFRYFMTYYLQNQYMNYLFTSSIQNKHIYIDYAIKLMYTTNVAAQKMEQLLEMAQIGPYKQ